MPLSRRSSALVLLTVQNATIALLTRQSRIGKPDELYLPSAAVLLAEILKILISLWTLAGSYRRTARSKKDDLAQPRRIWPASFVAPLREAVGTRRSELLKLSVPALLYAGQNNLLYIALSNLSAAMYQVTYQMKILTTALFSVMFFGRQYSAAKWAALCMLTCGVAIVQLPSDDGQAQAATAAPGQNQNQNQLLGFTTVFIACVSSGIAGCYFETLIKHTKKGSILPAAPLAMQNLQLALVSVPFSLFAIFGQEYDRQRVLHQGLLHNFGYLGLLVVLLQAAGGLLIARVVKEADSVSKGFATSFAVILSTIVSSFVSHSLPNTQFLVGASLVVCATTLFAAVP